MYTYIYVLLLADTYMENASFHMTTAHTKK